MEGKGESKHHKNGESVELSIHIQYEGLRMMLEVIDETKEETWDSYCVGKGMGRYELCQSLEK